MIAIFRLCFDPSHFPRPVGFSRTEKKRPAVCNGGQLGRNELCSVFPDTYFVSLELYFNVYQLYLDICIACILYLSTYIVCAGKKWASTVVLLQPPFCTTNDIRPHVHSFLISYGNQFSPDSSGNTYRNIAEVEYDCLKTKAGSDFLWYCCWIIPFFLKTRSLQLLGWVVVWPTLALNKRVWHSETNGVS